jgi:hypothetical protein
VVRKNAAKRKPAKQKAIAKKKTGTGKVRKKRPAKKGAHKGKNKLGVTNSLVNNINARKKKNKSRPKKKSTIASKAYKRLQNNWGK